MAKLKISFDKENCLGCGTCAAVCAENWFIGDDGKAQPKKTELSAPGCNQKAVDACPLQLIKLVKAK